MEVIDMAGMRTHTEASVQMALRFLDESIPILPGIDAIVGSAETRAALWCGSFAPDWWGVKNAVDVLKILSTLGDIIAAINRLGVPVPAELEALYELSVVFKNLPPLPMSDYAHWEPFTLQYAKWLRDSGAVADPAAVAFMLGIACHCIQDLVYHFEGPDFPYTDVQPPAVGPFDNDGWNDTQRKNRRTALGQDPSLAIDPPWARGSENFESRIAQILGWPNSEDAHKAIDGYLIWLAESNGMINRELQSFFATQRSARYDEMFKVYQTIQPNMPTKAVFDLYVTAHTALWTVEQIWFGVITPWYVALPEAARVALNLEVGGLPMMLGLEESVQVSQIPGPVDNFFYGGIVNEAAACISAVRRWFAYLGGTYLYQSEIPVLSPYPYGDDEMLVPTPQRVCYLPYLGTRDATILSYASDNNAGYEPLLAIGANPTGAQSRGLLRFELTKNPDATRNLPEVAIRSATLWLYLTNPQYVTGKGRQLAIYQVKREWQEGNVWTDGVTGFIGSPAKDASQSTWIRPWARPGCDDPQTDRAASPSTQRMITPADLKWDARMGVETDHGDWHNPYAACTRVTVSGRNYLFGQDLSSYRWFTQELLPGGKLAGSEADSKQWNNPYPVLVAYEREGRSFVFGHSPKSDNRWFIQELYADGKADPVESDHGTWNSYYGAGCLVTIGARTFLSGQDLSSHRWFIQELLPGGKLAEGETDAHQWANPYPVLLSYNAPDGTAYLFGHDPDKRRWFIQRFASDGKLIDGETDNGGFPTGRATACVVNVGERPFLFTQDRDTHHWYLNELLPNGKLNTGRSDEGVWGNPYRVMLPYSAAGRIFLFGHNASTANNWFIQEIDATGTWLSFDCTALVKQWVAPSGVPTEPNDGMLIVETGTTGTEPLLFCSAQAWNSSLGEFGSGERLARRPILLVQPMT
jgi:hypothetical protein